MLPMCGYPNLWDEKDPAQEEKKTYSTLVLMKFTYQVQ